MQEPLTKYKRLMKNIPLENQQTKTYLNDKGLIKKKPLKKGFFNNLGSIKF